METLKGTVARPEIPIAEPDNPEYIRLSRKEAEFWSKHHIFGADQITQRPDDQIQLYTNLAFTGSENVRWFETIKNYGEFRNGLVLGAGGTYQESVILETNPNLNLTFYDLSPAQVEERKQKLSPRFGHRIKAEVADLNFAQLKPNEYDAIISSGTLHHIINLEYLAEQINNALTIDGYFFLQDYTGESRFQFSEAKKKLIEDLYTKSFQRQNTIPPKLTWPSFDIEGSQHSPFEAVRSAETLGVLRSQLIEQERHSIGAVVGTMFFAKSEKTQKKPGPTERIRNKFKQIKRANVTTTYDFSDWIEVDKKVSKEDIMLPTNTFAIYRKKVT